MLGNGRFKPRKNIGLINRTRKSILSLNFMGASAPIWKNSKPTFALTLVKKNY